MYGDNSLKLFKYLIWAMTVLLLVLIAVMGVDFESGFFSESSPAKETVQIEELSEAPAQPEEIIEEVNTEVKIPELTEVEKEFLPAYIQAMPENPNSADMDGNLFRDDADVFIAYKFPTSPQRRAVYKQMAKIIDRVATDGGQTRLSRQVTLWKDEQIAKKCFLTSGFLEEDLEELRAFLLDTESRVEGYNNVIEIRKTIPEDLADSIVVPDEPCDPLILENEITLQNWVPKK